MLYSCSVTRVSNAVALQCYEGRVMYGITDPGAEKIEEKAFAE